MHSLYLKYFFPKKRINWVGVSLAGIMAVVSLFPVNFHSFSTSIRLNEVRTALTEQLGMTLPVTFEDYAGPYKVDYVIDGDTIIVLMEEKRVHVRLIGIDTPDDLARAELFLADK